MLRDIVRSVERKSSAVEEEIIPCIKALGRVAARNVKAGRNLPPFDVSALDGFACRGRGNEFLVKGSLGPGEKSVIPLKAGEAIFVPTGAAIPPRTRFVPVEQVREAHARILIQTSTDMRKTWKTGYWIKKSDEVIRKGESLTPRKMELLALAGFQEIVVFKKPKVCILSTGNELKKGIVPNSNQYLLAGLVERDGGVILRLSTAADDEEEIGEALAQMSDADLLLVTGGTAMGKRDVTRASFQALRANFLLEGLPIVPGKTMIFGELGQALFFILPGNPRAIRTLYEVLIKPCLGRLAGRTGAARCDQAKVTEEIEKESGRIHLVPVALSAGGEPYTRELYVDEPNAIIVLERGIKRVRAGKEVEIIWVDT
jgi:molybdopterin molybdotransferase